MEQARNFVSEKTVLNARPDQISYVQGVRVGPALLSLNAESVKVACHEGVTSA